MKFKKNNLTMFLMCIFLLMIAGGGSCDQTQLTGEVVVKETRVRTGEEVPLQLEVPEELSEIYRVEWEVEPQTKGFVIDGSELLESLTDKELEEYFGTGNNLNPDRIALLVAQEEGPCKIYVSGFFRQTNIQDITSIQLEIIP